MESLSIGLPVHFFSAGQFVAQPGWVHQKRKIDSSVLVVVDSGHLVLHEDEKRYEILPHQAIILRAGCTHWGEATPDDVAPVYYWAHFAPDEKHSTGQNVMVNQHIICKQFGRQATLFHQLINESRATTAHPLSCDYLLSLLLIYLSGDDQEVPSSKSICIRMQEYLRLNYKHNVTLHELSGSLHYNMDYLSRLFREEAGITIRQFLHRIRLTEAKHLLLSTVMSIKEISYACGYTNEKFFCTTFQKLEGISPSTYRELFKRLHQNNR